MGAGASIFPAQERRSDGRAGERTCGSRQPSPRRYQSTGCAESLGSTVVFLMFAVINFVSLAFVIKFVPETRGRTLEELEDDFRTHDAAHYTHEAPVGVYGS
jgi:hypothetical protein